MVTRLDDVPKELVVDFDVEDESIVESVHERLAAVQNSTGIAYCPAHGGYWLVTNYDDVYEVVRNDDVFSAVETSLTSEYDHRPIPVQYDPPEHTAYRQLLNPVFSPARMRALDEPIRETANKLLDCFARDGSCEFVSSFAHPLPTTTFLSLMGWPAYDEPKLSRWSEHLIVGKPGTTEEENHRFRMAARSEVQEYFNQIIVERRRNPDIDDVTGYLLRARYEGERLLTDDELLRILGLLMVAGLHTVRGIMGHGMIYLSENPTERKRLIEDPSLIPEAVEELLRLGVGTAPGRVVVKQVTLHGVTLQPGDRVLAFLSAANRDPSQFACPGQLQVDRPNNRHLTFAVGRHRCLGSNLARVELAIAFEQILRRIPDFRVCADKPPKFHHSQVRGIRELHLTFTPEVS